MRTVGWCVAFFCLCAGHSAVAGEYTPPGDQAVSLGLGVDGSRGLYRGACVTGDLVYEGEPLSESLFHQPIPLDRLEERLGVRRHGILQPTALQHAHKLQFLAQVQPSARALTLVYGYRVAQRWATLHALRPTELGKRVALLPPEQRHAVCGDEAVTGLELGGSLWVALRFEFLSSSLRDRFAEETGMEQAALTQVRAKLERVWARYENGMTVTLQAAQFGGDPHQLLKVLGEGKWHLTCFANTGSCLDTVEAIRLYAVGKGGLRDQLGKMTLDPESALGPAVLTVRTHRYDQAGLEALVSSPSLALPAEESLAYSRLAERLLPLRADLQQLLDLREEELSAGQRAERKKALRTVQDNLKWLQEGLALCTEAPDRCTEQEQGVREAWKPYALRGVEAPLWFLPICRAPKLFPESRVAVEAIVEQAGAESCEEAALWLEAASSLRLRSRELVELRLLAWLDRLQFLDVRGNRIASLEPLTTLPNLETVNLAYNHVVDPSPLLGLPRLREVRLQGNPLGVDVEWPPLDRLLLHENTLCHEARERVFARVPLLPEEKRFLVQHNQAPRFASTPFLSQFMGWASCLEVAPALDP